MGSLGILLLVSGQYDGALLFAHPNIALACGLFTDQFGKDHLKSFDLFTLGIHIAQDVFNIGFVKFKIFPFLFVKDDFIGRVVGNGA